MSFWFWSCMCVWEDEEGQVYPHRQGRPWPAAEPHTLTAGVDLSAAPHPPILSHTHQEHVFTEEPQTPG